MQAFQDRVVLLTGAASGIGRALAHELAKQGARLYVVDQDGEGLAKAAEQWPGNASCQTLDVTDQDALRTWIRETASAEGRLDYLFNNAGIGMAGEFRSMQADDWDRIIRVNLNSVFHGCHAAWPILWEQGHGHIVNTASLLGLSPSPLASLYSAAKHGVVGLSRTLAMEGAIKGIRVSYVCPGYIDTAIFEHAPKRDTTVADMMGLLPWRLYPADKAARVILARVAQGQQRIVFPFHARLSLALDRWVPGIYAWVNRRLLSQHRQSWNERS